MIKKLKKTGTDGLMIYFTKEEIEIYGLVKGDPIDVGEFLKQKKVKKNGNV